MAYIDTKYIGECETCRHHRSGKCDTWCDCGECYQPDMSNIPTADVVEVVRCEKCKDFESHGNGKAGICRNKKLKPCLRYATDFCSYGERK